MGKFTRLRGFAAGDAVGFSDESLRVLCPNAGLLGPADKRVAARPDMGRFTANDAHSAECLLSDLAEIVVYSLYQRQNHRLPVFAGNPASSSDPPDPEGVAYRIRTKLGHLFEDEM